MPVKIKICGITNLEDALDAVEKGCDGLGFCFYRKSPRFIDPLKAKSIIQRVPSRILKFGVFVDSPQKAIKKIADTCKLDILQLHGDETPEYCLNLKKYKVIKVFRIKEAIDLKDIMRYPVFGCLFDSFSPRQKGGTGKIFDWKDLIKYRSQITRTVFLSGGLNPRNVSRAIKLIRPDWVDVSSSVEVSPGRKDPKKIEQFIKAAHRD